jgi:choice-of-anchor B domain-containing protein
VAGAFQTWFLEDAMTLRSSCLSPVLVACLAALVPGIAYAHSEHKTLYVAARGSDVRDCRDVEAPCKTIARAMALAGKGDTVKVGSGRYSFRPDAPEEGSQLLGWVVKVRGGFDASREFSEAVAGAAPTVITGPAPRYRSKLEENGFVLPKSGRGEAGKWRLAQATEEAEEAEEVEEVDTLFVAPEGTDEGECLDPADPCGSITYALSVAASGDRIAVAQGAFLLPQEELETAQERNIEIEGGFSAAADFAARAAAPTYVVGASFRERDRLRGQNLTLVQDQKIFDIIAALPENTAAGTSAAACVNGSAGGHPCNGIDLISRMPLSAFSSNPDGANDIWGFVDKNDDREYAIIGLRNGTAVIDVTDPQNPSEVGTVPGLQTVWRDIKVYQFRDEAAGRWKAYAYVTADAVNQGFQIIDLTGLPSSVSLAATINDFASAHNIYMANVDYGTGVPLPGQQAFAYILGSNLQNGAFRILDLSDPVAPTLATAPPLGTGYVHDATSVIIDDARVSDCAAGHDPCELLIDYNENTVDFWDVTDKSSPLKLSSLSYPNASYTHSGWWSKDKRFVYVQDELDEKNRALNTRLVVLDLADLTNPQVAGTWTGPTKAIDHNGFTLEDEYYMSNYRRGLTVLDLTTPANPTEKLFFDTFLSPAENDAAFNGAWGTYPYLPSGTILVSDIEGGLFLLKKSAAGPGPAPHPPGAGDRYAFAWANQPTTLSYAPNALYSYNPSGDVRISRVGTGSYVVSFKGFGGNGRAGGSVQVTGYGPRPNRCKVVGWSSSGANFDARVGCHRPDGRGVDERFSISIDWSG